MKILTPFKCLLQQAGKSLNTPEHTSSLKNRTAGPLRITRITPKAGCSECGTQTNVNSNDRT